MVNMQNTNLVKLKLLMGLIAVSIVVVTWTIWSSFAQFKHETLYKGYIEEYEQSKQDFCYDRSIRPCNEDGIWEWNNTHENDKFILKTAQQLMNRGRASSN